MADHTTYRVYCRHVPSCGDWPRLTRPHADMAAEAHTDENQHPTEIVRVTYTVLRSVEPRLKLVRGLR